MPKCEYLRFACGVVSPLRHRARLLKRIALIADDHPIYLSGLHAFLTNGLEMEVQEAGNYHELVQRVQEHSYALIVMDYDMPAGRFFDALQRIRDIDASVPILVSSAVNEEAYAPRIIKAGADGFVSKRANRLTMRNAVRRVLSGSRYFNPTIATHVADALHDTDDHPLAALSHREFEIFSCVAKGETIKSIASNLNLSDKTISTYKRRICDKLGIDNTQDIVKRAIEWNVIDRPF